MPKILVVEDEDQIRAEVIDWLQFEGYEVAGAANGRLGLAAAQRDAPDLIISDIAMPEMDGYALLLEVRADPLLQPIPFIFLTAATERASFRLGMESGADDYLTKPFTHAEVLNAVRSRLAKQAALEAHARAQVDKLAAALSEEREKRLLKSRLVAMFSHDFRNPLNAIFSNASLLRNYEERLDQATKHLKLERIMEAVQLLLQMVDDMLMVAELEKGYGDLRAEPLSPAAFIGAIVEEFRTLHSPSHRLLFESACTVFVALDARLLRQIVTNLLSNAIKYSPAGGTVQVGLWTEDAALVLRVQDGGIGIPTTEQVQLFEPFFRASNARRLSGTGLGLTIVKEAVELCGGTIEVESPAAQGAIFTVRLPLS